MGLANPANLCVVRVLLCDDDAHLRVVLRGIMRERNHEVVGEAETATDSKALVATAQPDLVVIDLSLRLGSGAEVGRMAAAHGSRVIVFSAFLDSISETDFADAVVAKPDFFALEAAIDALALRNSADDLWDRAQPDRRTSGSVAGRDLPPAPIDPTDSFYQALGNAVPGDSLVLIDIPSGPTDAEALAIVARGVIRPHDHLMLRDAQVALLLVGGAPDAGVVVTSRLMKATADAPYGAGWTWRYRMLGENESPAEVYQELRHQS
jgi:CheY-like chemotaxis protein